MDLRSSWGILTRWIVTTAVKWTNLYPEGKKEEWNNSKTFCEERGSSQKH